MVERLPFLPLLGEGESRVSFGKPPPMPSFLYPADNAARDFFTGISGRLGTEIIRIAVNHNRPAYDILHPEPIRHHSHAGTAAASKQRGQIAGMFRMGHHCRIVVTAGTGKVLTGTVPAVMDMKTKKAGTAGIRKIVNPGYDQNLTGIWIKRTSPCSDGAVFPPFTVAAAAGRAEKRFIISPQP